MELLSGNTRNKVVPGLAILLVLVLGFFAFKNGFGLLSPTGLVSLENSSMTGSFYITENPVKIPAARTIVRFSAPVEAKIITNSGTINATGNFWIQDFEGTMEWDGDDIILEGTMASVHGSQLDITYERKSSSTIVLKAGSVQAETVNVSSFSHELTGNIRFENRWNVKINDTPVELDGYRGSINIQKVGNDTTMMMAGVSDGIKVEQDNFLKHIT